MTRIDTLYFKNNKYYDYPVEGGKHRHSRVNTTIKVWHEDGTFTIGYQYGEQQFTYDQQELSNRRLADACHKLESKRRKELLDKLNTLSTQELTQLVRLLKL